MRRRADLCGEEIGEGFRADRSGRWARQARHSCVPDAFAATAVVRMAGESPVLEADAGSGWRPKAAEVAANAATSIARRAPRELAALFIDPNILPKNGMRPDGIPRDGRGERRFPAKEGFAAAPRIARCRTTPPPRLPPFCRAQVRKPPP